jgi:hypothetical protein
MGPLVVIVAGALVFSSAGCGGKATGGDRASMDAAVPSAPTTGSVPSSGMPDDGGRASAGGTLEEREAAICSILKTTGQVDDRVVQSLLGDAASCIVRVSDYDNSCKTDSDCVDAFSGDTCSGPCAGCENVTINVSAWLRYRADLARTPFGFCDISCNCPGWGRPQCVDGICGRSGLKIYDRDAGKP